MSISISLGLQLASVGESIFIEIFLLIGVGGEQMISEGGERLTGV
jgi:hypothetical protein